METKYNSTSPYGTTGFDAEDRLGFFKIRPLCNVIKQIICFRRNLISFNRFIYSLHAPTITCWPLSIISSVELSLNEKALPPKKADFSTRRTFSPFLYSEINEDNPDIPPPTITTSYFFKYL